MKVLRWVAVAAGSAVVGWLVCYVTALLVLHTFRPEPIDITLTQDDDE